MVTKLQIEYYDWLKGNAYYNDKVRTRFYGVTHFEEFKEFEGESKLDNANDPFFISDHHFNHKHIIKFSDRPFRDLDEMENKLVELHNMVVSDNDVVVFVGDFGFCNMGIGKRILERLNGYKILVMGNHDIHHGKFKNFGYDEVFTCKEMIYDGVELKITHFPLEESVDGLNIHGHVHVGAIFFKDTKYHYNVNCEFINYTPKRLSTIISEWRSIND